MDRPTPPPPVPLNGETRLDEFMRALLESGPTGSGVVDPQALDVESRLAQVLVDVGLLPAESDPATPAESAVAWGPEPPGREHRTIWRGTSTAVSRSPASELRLVARPAGGSGGAPVPATSEER